MQVSELKTGYRELSGGGLATPLRQFIGRLKAFTPEVRQTGTGDRTFVKLDFIDVEVIESTEAYLFPVAQIELPYNEWRNTIWGTLLESIEKVLGPGNVLEDMVGKLATWYVELDKFMFISTRGETAGQPVTRDCLTVVGMAEGEAAETAVASAVQVALSVLNGKTLKEFNDVIFETPEVRADKELMAAIIAGTWADEMVTLLAATVDEDGVYRVA